MEVKPKYHKRDMPLWQGLEGEPKDEFAGMPVPKRLLDAMRERGIVEPSGIQSVAIPVLSTGEGAVVHSPTGGGKTLAFLLPLLARLRPTMHVGLQAIVLVPSPELALQTTREMKWMIDALCGPERVCWFNPQVPRELACEVLLSRKGLWDTMRQDTAVMISTTPIIAAEIRALQGRREAETMAYFLCSNLETVLLDEVDAMIPTSKTKIRRIGSMEWVMSTLFGIIRMRYRNRPVQLVCSSATADRKKVVKWMDQLMAMKWTKRRDAARRTPPVLLQDNSLAKISEQRDPRIRGLVPTNLVPPGITHALAVLPEGARDNRFGQERLKMLAKVLPQLRDEGIVLVFVPENMRLTAAVLTLHEAGVTEASKYRSDIGLGIDVDTAETALRRGQEFEEQIAEGGHRVLVAKAGDVRGVDVKGVDYVVLVQVPTSATQYLHLAGRTGRMGKTGTAITIATSYQVRGDCDDIAQELGIEFKGWDVDRGEVTAGPPQMAGAMSEEFEPEVF